MFSGFDEEVDIWMELLLVSLHVCAAFWLTFLLSRLLSRGGFLETVQCNSYRVRSQGVR